MDRWILGGKKTIITLLILIAIIGIALLLINGFINGHIETFLSNFLSITSPITIGFILAYLSSPIINILEEKLFKWIKNFTLKRLLSIILTFIFVIFIILVIITILIPNLLTTVRSFWDTYIVNYESAAYLLANKINLILDRFPAFDSMQRIDPYEFVVLIRSNLPWIDQLAEGDLSVIFPQSFLPQDNTVDSSIGFDASKLLNSDSFWSILSYVFTFGSSIFNFIKNLVLGLFVAIYMLMSKEKVKAYCKRFLNGFLSPDQVKFTYKFASLLDNSFGGFIEGQLLDAFIVGIITYILFSLFNFANPLLLATIIAVTNVIPVLGPFIGGVPASFLVLLMQPEKLILFIFLIILVQQIDGNIICPHILGDKINISSLTTLVAIITMGGLFGILGMLIGVPIFAVLIQLINDLTENALRKKNLDASINQYYPEDYPIKAKKDKSIKILSTISYITKKLLNNKKIKRRNKK